MMSNSSLLSAEPFNWVMEWKDIITPQHFISLLEKHFFPRWIQVCILNDKWQSFSRLLCLFLSCCSVFVAGVARMAQRQSKLWWSYSMVSVSTLQKRSPQKRNHCCRDWRTALLFMFPHLRSHATFVADAQCSDFRCKMFRKSKFYFRTDVAWAHKRETMKVKYFHNISTGLTFTTD